MTMWERVRERVSESKRDGWKEKLCVCVGGWGWVGLASVSLPFVFVCVRREELSQFVDLWEWRPKAALAKPSKAPSGSLGPCVTPLTKITFSSGPLSLAFLLPSCPLCPSPANLNGAGESAAAVHRTQSCSDMPRFSKKTQLMMK